MDDIYLELLGTFIAESVDYLDEVEPKLIQLAAAYRADVSEEQRAEAKDLMNGVFRLVHSMKGNSATLELKNIANLAHKAENLLDDIRNGKVDLSDARVNLLCRTLDMLRLLMSQLQETRHDQGHEEAIAALVEELLASQVSRPTELVIPRSRAISDGVFVFEEDEPASAPTTEAAPSLVSESVSEQMVISDELRQSFVKEADELMEKTEQSIVAVIDAVNGEHQPIVIEAFRAIHSFKGNCGFMGFVDMEKLSHAMETVLGEYKESPQTISKDRGTLLLGALDQIKTALANLSRGQSGTIPEIERHLALIKGAPAPVAAVVPIAAAKSKAETKSAPAPAAPAAPASVQRADIRVDLKKLDSLINLVGELVIAEAMVAGCSALSGMQDEQLERTLHHLRRVTLDLQDVSMSVRMVPVAQTFRKMIRLVHDVAAKTGKKAKLILLGEDTEVDKTVIEAISDPLVHVVRNSMDHGLELPDTRADEGKPIEGTITIEARHEGGEVWISVSDDGKGLDREKILRKAREKGLITETDDSKIPDGEAYRLIFEPGFSTADKVTDISGRGVGMDVVRKNIEKIKGRVRVDSKPGQGSVVTFQIPLTLAIIDGMLVRIGESRYTIPLLSIRESIVAQPEMLTVGPDGQEYALVREDFIPIVRLLEIYGVGGERRPLSEMTLVIVDVNRQLLALTVDEVLGQQQTVIKPLSNALGRARHVSGCTILGNGEISLIADVSGLAETLRSQYEQFTGSRTVVAEQAEDATTQQATLPVAS